MNHSIIPSDSAFHDWLTMLSQTEIPVSYQLAVGLSALGGLFKRSVYVDQERWRIYPNISVLLVGPSGIGKDTAIDAAEEMLQKVGKELGAEDYLPSVVGRTIEGMYTLMAKIGPPSAFYIPAHELASLLGRKDYQSGIVQELTNLLSTKAKHDASTKGEKLVIQQPTPTVLAGTTAEWLQNAMPEGTLEGGFFPRFLLVCEDYNSKNIPLLKYSTDRRELVRIRAAEQAFIDHAAKMVKQFQGDSKEMVPLVDARTYYENWYINRLSYFSSVVKPYANRSRDQVLRIAMVMALSRGHAWIEECDIRFAVELMGYVAARIDAAVKPPRQESRLIEEILVMLPASQAKISKALRDRYRTRDIVEAINHLYQNGEIVKMENKWVMSMKKEGK